MDKAGKKYWNDSWNDSVSPDAVNPLEQGIDNWVNLRLHDFFVNSFNGMETSSMKILEIGCANSSWLPYFSKEFGFEIFGLDYSPVGCELTEITFKKNNVDGTVVCADFFSPPVDLIETFDIVVSFGVVEHFEDTSACIIAISAFLKPGGLLITNIPNMVGLIGSVEKLVNRPVYDIHQPIDSSLLRKVHSQSGLKVLECDYFMSTNFGVCNLIGIPSNTFQWFVKKFLLGALTRMSRLIWFLEKMFGAFRSSRAISPYINCVARK